MKVRCREVPFWSDNAHVTDDESSPKVTYNDRVIQETFGERIKDRLQDWRDRRDEYFDERREKRDEKKERKRLAKLGRVKTRKPPRSEERNKVDV